MELNQKQRQQVRALVELAASMKEQHRYTYERRKELAEAIVQQQRGIQERRRKLDQAPPYRGSDSGLTRQGYEDAMARYENELATAREALLEMQHELGRFDAKLEEKRLDMSAAGSLAERVLERAGLAGDDLALTRLRFTGLPVAGSASAELNTRIQVSVPAKELGSGVAR